MESRLSCGADLKQENDEIEDLAILPLLPASAVVSAACGSFTSQSSIRSELAVATCDSVKLYGINEDAELRLLGKATLAPILALYPLRKSSFKDILLVVTGSQGCGTLQDFKCHIVHFASGLQVGSSLVIWPHSQLSFPNEGAGRVINGSLERNVQPRKDRNFFPQGQPGGAYIVDEVLDQKTYPLIRKVYVVALESHLHGFIVEWPSDDGLAKDERTCPTFFADPGKEAPVAIMYEDAFVNVQAMTSLPRSHSPWITLAVLASNEDETRSIYFLGENKNRRLGIVFTLSMLHPTTTLMTRLEPSDTQSAPLVVLSQHTALFPEPREKKVALEVNLGMRGLPTAHVILPNGNVLVADSKGSLIMLARQEKHNDWTLITIQHQLPACSPNCLVLLQQGEQPGMLFVGSCSSPSILAKVSMTETQCLILQSLQNPISNGLAPIVDAFCFTEKGGCGEGLLLLCCGLSPAGCICLGRMAVAFIPDVVDQEKLEAVPSMMTISQDPNDLNPHRKRDDAYLVLSFEVSGSTTVLDIRGTTLSPVTPDGLDLSSATLLLQRLPHGIVLQVTPQAIRLITPDLAGLISCIELDGIDKAAHHSSLLAVASGSQVQVYDIAEGRSEGAALIQTWAFPEQISALTVFGIPGQLSEAVRPTADDQIWVVVGLWGCNEIWFQGLGATEPEVQIPFWFGQPRSLALGVFEMGAFSEGALSAEAASILFVGTSDGAVVFFQIGEDLKSLEKEQCRVVRAGVSSVDLQWHATEAKAGSYMLGIADQAVMIRQQSIHEAGAKYPVECLGAFRVDSPEGVSSTCSIQHQEMGHLHAWVDSLGRLNLGHLDQHQELRIKRRVIGDSPHKLVYQEATGCALLLSEADDGQSILRLFHAASLSELASVSMGPCTGLALCLASLLPGGTQTADHPKEVVLLSSFSKEKDPEVDLHRTRHWLHVLEVARRESTGPEPGSFGLILHGSAEVESPCFSLTTVPDHSLRRSSDEGVEKPTAEGPHLILAGCMQGIYLYRLALDSLDHQYSKRLQKTIQELEAGPSRFFADSSAQSSFTSEDTRISSPGWQSCLRAELLSKGLEEGVGCVVQLAGQGARVAAVEMLGCLTVYEVKSSLSVSKSKCMLMTPSQRQDLSKSARLKRVAADSTGEGPLSAIYVRGEGGWGPWQVLGATFGRYHGLCLFGLLEGLPDQNLGEFAHFPQDDEGDNALSQSGESPTLLTKKMTAIFNESITCLLEARLGLQIDGRGESLQECAGHNDGEPPKPILYTSKQGGIGMLQPFTSNQSFFKRFMGLQQSTNCTVSDLVSEDRPSSSSNVYRELARESRKAGCTCLIEEYFESLSILMRKFLTHRARDAVAMHFL